MGDGTSRQWRHARRYILDPLTGPEPSQETGPGSSFLKEKQKKHKHHSKRRHTHIHTHTHTHTRSHSHSRTASHSQRSHSRRDKDKKKKKKEQRPAQEPKPPPPESVEELQVSPPGSPDPDTAADPFEPSPLSSRSSPASRSGRPPDQTPSGSRNPNPSNLRLGRRGFVTRTSAMTTASPSTNPFAEFAPSSRESSRQSRFVESASIRGGHPHRTQHEPWLRSRHAGDMSHRPLDMIRREARMADRGASSRHRRVVSLDNDLIDSLDKSGPFGTGFHHEGPYDATLLSRNCDPIYSPVAAVRESNMAALRATPREYIRDSLERHVPLQGTATIPPGHEDLSGNIMDYEEGADLMREDDAPGGAYKRWGHIQYHPNDLKGKGEPSYMIERDLKAAEGERRRRMSTGADSSPYEMQSFVSSQDQRAKDVPIRQRERSVSDADVDETLAYTYGGVDAETSSSGGIHFHHGSTTGKRISDRLMRRFGSLRRKRAGAADEVYA